MLLSVLNKRKRYAVWPGTAWKIILPVVSLGSWQDFVCYEFFCLGSEAVNASGKALSFLQWWPSGQFNSEVVL